MAYGDNGGDNGNGHGASLSANTTEVKYLTYVTNSQPFITYTLTNEDLNLYNNWIFVEINKDKNNVVSIFVNGSFKVKGTFDVKDSPYYWDRLLIGNWINNYWHNYFNGYLYDIRFYDYPLHTSDYTPDFEEPEIPIIFPKNKFLNLY